MKMCSYQCRVIEQRPATTATARHNHRSPVTSSFPRPVTSSDCQRAIIQDIQAIRDECVANMEQRSRSACATILQKRIESSTRRLRGMRTSCPGTFSTISRSSRSEFCCALSKSSTKEGPQQRERGTRGMLMRPSSVPMRCKDVVSRSVSHYLYFFGPELKKHTDLFKFRSEGILRNNHTSISTKIRK